MPATKRKPKPKKTAKKRCLMIQWSLTDGKGGYRTHCPSCGEPGEQVMGMVGPCMAHKH